MGHRVVRVGLVLIMIAVAVVAGFHLVTTQQQINSARDAEHRFATRAWELSIALAHARADHNAYVATGQDPSGWVEHGSAHLRDVAAGLETLAASATSPDAVQALAAAGAGVERLTQLDLLVREQIAAGHHLLASDVIFTDGHDVAAQIGEHLDAARMSERAAAIVSVERRQSDQALTLAAAVGVGAVVVLLLLPGQGRPAVQTPSEHVPSDEKTNTEPAAQTEVRGSAPAPSTLLELDLPPAETAPPAPSPAAAPTAPDLQLAAALCTDLGRLGDADHLVSLLERAGTLLDATGLVVWVQDGTGEALRPAAAAGYPPQAVRSIGLVPRDADNATAAAFRTGELQVVRHDDDHHGAIAAPLLTPLGCVGVMSIELHDGAENLDAVKATVSIVAAQLATLVAADPPAQPERVQEAPA